MNLSLLFISRYSLPKPYSSIIQLNRFLTDNAPEKAINHKTWKEKRQYDRFGHDEWRPKKRLTRYQMDYLKDLHNTSPTEWTIAKLSKRFLISHSAVRRILKSKFEPSEEIRIRQDKTALENRQTRKQEQQFKK